MIYSFCYIEYYYVSNVLVMLFDFTFLGIYIYLGVRIKRLNKSYMNIGVRISNPIV